MPTVAGIDCSTQSTKVVVCDADSGTVLATGTAPHPDATEVDPAIWWSALEKAAGGPDGGLLQGVDAVAVGGQQHGMVLLDGQGEVVRPALLWNDTRSATDAADLVAELGGGDVWAGAVGSVPVASFTVTKLRWTARNEPDSAARAEAVLLPHDWLTWRLLGGGGSGGADSSVPMTTDRGDASGTGYWSPGEEAYRTDLLVAAFGRELRVPDVLPAAGQAGRTPAGALVACGTGDNMATALGLGLETGDLVISLGTSGTAFAVTDAPAADASGAVAGFADATGRFLPLVCTLNAARVLDVTAQLLGTDHDGLSRLALEAPAGADGLTFLPYLDGERTPDLPQARGSLHGMRRDNLTPANLARAAVEGMLCGLADGVDALRAQGLTPRRALLVGGAARSAAVRQVAAEVLGVPVTVPAPAEYVALGAARQAAWTLAGSSAPPEWTVELSPATEPGSGDGAAVRAAYSAAREALHG